MGKVILTRWDEEPDLPRHEIVDGLFAAGEVVLLTGQPKSGKSAVAVALAGSIATGEPFLGRDVEKGEVVYFALERRQSLLRRIKALGVPASAAPIWTPRGNLVITEDVEEMIEGIAASKGGPRVIIFDTLARLITGLDENSAKDMGIVARAIMKVGAAFPEAALVFIHHTGKDGSSLRGSSALLGAVDLELRAEIRKAQRYLRVANANEVAEDQRLDFQLELVPMPDGGTAICAVAPSTGGQATIRDRNDQRREAADARALEALAHLPASPFTQAVAKAVLTEAGLVEGTDDARKKQVKRLTDRLKAMGRLTERDGKMTLEEGP